MVWLGADIKVIGGIVGGVALGFAILAALYAGSMALYFLAKKKWACHKWRTEIVFVGAVIFVSFAVKFVVFLLNNEFNGKWYSGANAFWQALYASIGGLTFEGLDDQLEVKSLLACFYYGSSIYAGLMILSVFTMKWSYEIYSFMMLLLRKEKNTDIYVFTALTEETLQLAKSIKEEYEKNEKRNDKKKCRIVFSGPKLDAFDRNDDLCRQLMSYDFLYWSYYKETDGKKNKKDKYKNRSLADILHLNNKNIRGLGKKDKDIKAQEARFCIFAFESKDHIPEEEDNMGFVFEDIKNRIFKSEKDSLRIEYYILTKRDIDYQAYDYKNRELMLDFASSFDGVKIKRGFKKKAHYESLKDEYKQMQNIFETVKSEKFKKIFLADGNNKYDGNSSFKETADNLKIKFARRVIVRTINEALIISKDAIKDIVLPFEEENYTQSDSGGEKLNVYVLGFGSTGQAIAKAIHMRSAYINSDGYATDIHFDVFDSNADNIGGLFAKEHPMWICKSEKEVKQLLKDNSGKSKKTVETISIEDKSDNEIEFTRTVEKDTGDIDEKTFLAQLYFKEKLVRLGKINESIYNEEYRQKGFANLEDIKTDVNKEIILPTVYFHSKSCFDIAILEQLDSVTGAESNIYPPPSIIVVALGSDYDNIKMANALILDIIREGEREESKGNAQTIIVNIWDSHNNDLIDSASGVWDEKHKILELKSAKLTVKIVGNNDDIYTYKNIVNYEKSLAYSWGYNSIYNYIVDQSKGDGKEFNNLIKTFILEDKSYEKMAQFIKESIIKDHQDDQKATLQEKAEYYESQTMWSAESTDCVYQIREMFKTLLNRASIILESGAQQNEAMVKLFSYLSKVEHQRWLRLHIANGWTYAQQKNILRLQHNCIKPFKYLHEGSLYNIINVKQALKDCLQTTGALEKKIDLVVNEIIKNAEKYIEEAGFDRGF